MNFIMNTSNKNKKYDGKLLFTDTGGLVYEIKTEDIYENFCKDKNLFDFSE